MLAAPMSNFSASDSTARAGQSEKARETVQAHTLIALVQDRTGAVDRVVGLMRRRRANMQTLVLGRSEVDGVVRVTVSVDDSEVAVEHLVEQLRKILDVRNVINIPEQEAISRELALIKVAYTPAQKAEIFEIAQLFSAHVVDVAAETMTLEVSGSTARVEKCVAQLHPYGIREVARSGRVTMARGTND